MADLTPLPDFRHGVYRHFKGNLYKTVSVVRDSETLEPAVVYQDVLNGGLWVRSYKMFMGEAKPGVSRFAYMPEI